MNAGGLVLDYLHSLQERGVSRLPVDEEARAILREWMLAARRGTRAVAAAVLPQQVAAPAQAAPLPPPDAAAEVSAVDFNLREGIPDVGNEYVEEEPQAFFRPFGNTEEDVWASARQLLTKWQPLQQLGTLRPTPVFGTGDRRAAVMFVGDAPNYQDEKEGTPFRGEAGGKLDGMLKAMGLTREQVYLTHIVKFRPAQPRQTINTRPPTEKEVNACLPVLDWEIRTVQPRVIVALGVIAARGLLGGGNLPLSAYQQQHGNYNGIPVVVTHHPSYLLRTSDLTERRRLWEEMLAVMEMAGLPINDKQRGYFLPKKG